MFPKWCSMISPSRRADVADGWVTATPSILGQTSLYKYMQVHAYMYIHVRHYMNTSIDIEMRIAKPSTQSQTGSTCNFRQAHHVWSQHCPPIYFRALEDNNDCYSIHIVSTPLCNIPPMLISHKARASIIIPIYQYDPRCKLLLERP